MQVLFASTKPFFRPSAFAFDLPADGDPATCNVKKSIQQSLYVYYVKVELCSVELEFEFKLFTHTIKNNNKRVHEFRKKVVRHHRQHNGFVTQMASIVCQQRKCQKNWRHWALALQREAIGKNHITIFPFALCYMTWRKKPRLRFIKILL